MLGKRLARLEANRPKPGAFCAVDMAGLAPDLVARVMQAKADGTFPQTLRDTDLQSVLALANEQEAT